MIKQDIKNFTLEEIENLLTQTGEKSYRAQQIFHWIYKKGIKSFKEMTDIPEKIKNKIEEGFYISAPFVHDTFKSKDGTEKFVFKLQDNNLIETVLIPSYNRNTVCVSTQVGCKYRCKFCASGKRFVRNLTPGEIINQIMFPVFFLQKEINNVVVMGMGEPFDNFDSLIKFIKILNSIHGINIGARKITVSTCGIITGIEKLSKIPLQIRLSVSLHSVNDKIRNILMPVNKQYPVELLIKSCKAYTKNTGRRITIEYILIKNTNDSVDDALKLSALSMQLKASINLILCQHVPGKDFYPPEEKTIKRFTDVIKKSHVRLTIRHSKGADIKAACGQLAGYYKDNIFRNNNKK
ncbi:MAG: 23S rRNA (adenine(2503)-C(2))-methyltransferase RlmN [Candidatus Omnitrophica bacterium]|nr:23S rRNA (adenine(2503)-C(2))-methyltransferase RlmN [Candidatus Omnitrophota bacterium]